MEKPFLWNKGLEKKSFFEKGLVIVLKKKKKVWDGKKIIGSDVNILCKNGEMKNMKN